MNNVPAPALSYNSLWDETVRMLKAHGAVLVPLAGVFIFLPNLLSTYFIPLPSVKEVTEIAPLMSDYLGRNWHWQMLLTLANSLGAISIILVLLGRGNTV